MTTQEKIALIEETLDFEEGTLTPETVLADLDDYDSMAKLSLIVMFDEEFNIKLSGEKIKGFKTVSDILMATEE